MTGKKSKTIDSPAQREENDLWRAVVGSVKPLGGRQEVIKSPPPVAVKRTKPLTARIDSPSKLPDPGGNELPATDRRTTKRVKKGKVSIEARVDLHGMTQHQAHGVLAAFIAESYGLGRRCVLVITGKGRGDAAPGVLRSGVPKWLNQSPNREKIISFTQAAPRDGGDGALYVLLKKKR